MGYWNSRGLRGSVLEELINMTNDLYRREGVALIQKIPTPIKPVDFDSEKKMIRLAYFEQKSTVDYIGVMRGNPMCFDAKETGKKSLPFSNIHEHQVKFMRDFTAQGGLAFLLVHFSARDEYFLLPFEILEEYFQGGSRKSIPYEAFDPQYEIPYESGGCLHYLKAALKYYQNQRKIL